jgi:hypothetical protein
VPLINRGLYGIDKTPYARTGDRNRIFVYGENLEASGDKMLYALRNPLKKELSAHTA